MPTSSEVQSGLFKEVYGPKITCKCPLCEKHYQSQLIWLGRGVPRIYCPTCVDNLRRCEQIELIEPHDPMSHYQRANKYA